MTKTFCTCVGCDASLPRQRGKLSIPQAPHMVGVGMMPTAIVESHAIDSRSDGTAIFATCVECWRTPQHRTRRLKLHFFDPRIATQALSAAGASDLG